MKLKCVANYNRNMRAVDRTDIMTPFNRKGKDASNKSKHKSSFMVFRLGGGGVNYLKTLQSL